MRVENWCGYDIRFVEINGEWYAILKDICDALRLRTDAIARRLDPDMLERVEVRIKTNMPSRYGKSKDNHTSSVDNFSNEFEKTVHMLAVNEIGIYEALFASRRLEARKFRRWSAGVMSKLRNQVGLKQYEVMRMTDPDIQEEIDCILDTLYWDDEKKCVMQSVTVQGGDVEQVVFSK